MNLNIGTFVVNWSSKSIILHPINQILGFYCFLQILVDNLWFILLNETLLYLIDLI